jgi:hypothetical protein
MLPTIPSIVANDSDQRDDETNNEEDALRNNASIKARWREAADPSIDDEQNGTNDASHHSALIDVQRHEPFDVLHSVTPNERHTRSARSRVGK